MYPCPFCKNLLDLPSTALWAYKDTYTSVVADKKVARVVQGGPTGLEGSKGPHQQNVSEIDLSDLGWPHH